MITGVSKIVGSVDHQFTVPRRRNDKHNLLLFFNRAKNAHGVPGG
jgi:hypothetical protein